MDTDFFAFPTSFTQRRLWFLDQLQPDSAAYNVSQLITLTGPLDECALRAALQELVRRHETLRTTLPAIDGQPYQLISSQAQLPLRHVDMRGWRGARQADTIARIYSEEAADPFDLAAGPLARMSLLQGHAESYLLVTLHHAITDGSSMEVLAAEVSALYAAYSRNAPSPLPDLALQYGDYAVWQRQWLAGHEAREQLAYWKTKLTGAPAVLELPWDRARPAEQVRAGAAQTFTLSRRLSQEILRLARHERVTPYMVLLAAFQILMTRLTASRDIVVGTPIAGRSRTELEGLIGFFVNTLALRTDLGGNPTLREILRRAESTAMDAYARQDLPFDRLVAELAPDRTLAYNPVVQVLFALQNVGGVPVARQLGAAEPAAADAAEPDGPVEGGRAGDVKFDLTWALVESEAGFAGHVEYSEALLNGETVRRWIGLYQRTLTALTAAPDRHLEALTLLSPVERARAIDDWNETRSCPPGAASLGALFVEQAGQRGAAIAVVYGQRSLDYTGLEEQSRHLAHRLRRAGVMAGDRVALCLPRSPELIVAMLAVVRLGAAYVPLDPDHPAERIRAIALDAGATLVLTPDALAQLPACSSAPPLGDVDPAAIAYVIYTSGSTGLPKGVSIDHRAVVRLVRDTNYIAIEADDRIAQAANAAFDAATFEVWGALLNGATLVGIDRETVLSPRRYAEALEQNAVSVLFVTTALFNQIARETPAAFARLKQVMFGGETADPRAVRAVLGAGRPARLMNMYGPTEATTFATFHEIDELPDDHASIPIGRPIGNTEVYVLDDRGEPQLVGVDGELYLGGPGLAAAYWQAPALTAERFVPDPFHPGKRLYRTGDIVRYRPDGILDFVGRRDHQIKMRGFRVELGEIEAAVVAHEAVRDAVVVPQAAGGSVTQLIGYVVWHSGRHATLGALRSWVATRLPGYMVPALWIELAALPLNRNGKVDRRALPAPGMARPELSTDYLEPGTATEVEIAAIWSRLLGLERVGLHDNFFALGGHSLLATQAVARVRDRFGVDMPVRVVFERPTVAGLADWTDERAVDELPSPASRPIARRQALGPAPLSFSQQRLWFLDQLDPRSTLYNIHTVWTGPERLHHVALERAVGQVIRRHEALRTRFAVTDGVAVQIVDPPSSSPVAAVDLSRLPIDAAEQEYRRRAGAETPFDLAAGPLFRAELFTVALGDHRLVMKMHHVISDGWSLGILHRELDELYDAFSSGREPTLPTLTLQYADFAVWQRQRLQGPLLEELLAWWRGYLQGAPQVTNLPTDRPRPSERSFRGEVQTKRLADSLRPPLEQLGQREGATLFITLLTAWYVLLYRFAGETDVVIGTPIANRTRSELEPLIGFFVNTLLIRAPIETGPEGRLTFRELLRQVRDAASGAYAHQDLPFERLVAELAPERRLSHTPLFQCFFALQDGVAGRPSRHAWPEEIEVTPATSMFDLSLTILDQASTLAASFEYSTELFDTGTIARLIGHLERLLQGVAADPDRSIDDYDLISAEERAVVLECFNATAAPYPPVATVVELFEARARALPSAPAVRSEDGALSYVELDRAANRLANHLTALGVTRGALVGLAIDRSLDTIVALFGILKAGAAYVPLDPQYPTARVARMIAEAGMAAIVTSADAAASLPHESARVVCVDLEAAAIAACSATRPVTAATADDIAYVIYTSGSTGEPKGVPITHRSLLNYNEAASECYEISGRDLVLQFGSLTFDASVEEIFPILSRGGLLVLRTPAMSASLADFVARCSEWGITVVSLPTAFWHEWVARLATDRLALPASLRLVIIGGDRALPERVREWMSAVDGRVQLTNGYGPTEATVVATVHRLSAVDGQRGEVAIGRPIRNTRVYVLDRLRQPVPIGVHGELWIAGDSLSPGYLHRPDLTQERFVADPFHASGGRMYRSGDVARWRADGVLEFRGRADRQVKVRGFRIELGEIESVLHQHDAVHESVVVADEDGTGHRRLVAYVVPDPRYGQGEDAEPQQLEAWKAVFDDLYAEIDPTHESGFYIKGWDSSYTGAPMPAAEVEAWMRQTVERILALQPSRVREIGCGGSGLMLFRIAPACEVYTATDLSMNAVRVLQHQLDRLAPALPGVEVLQRPAHAQALAPGSVDTLLAVSVAQYFPTIDYLLEVLTGAVEGVAPGGAIFLGDLRNHTLLDAFHASVQLAVAEPSLPIEELGRRVRRELAAEKQLTVDPAFFHALSRHIPRITAVEARLLRGRNRNELTRFRYDLILRLGERPDSTPVSWLDWYEARASLATVRTALAGHADRPHAWSGVPNARVHRDVVAARVVAAAGGGPPGSDNGVTATVAALRSMLDREDPAIDPEDLWDLGESLGWTVDIMWPAASIEGRFDVLFRPGRVLTPPPSRVADLTPRPWSAYANDPTRRASLRELVPGIRAHCVEHLPAYMLPAHIVVLDSLPLTPTGKLDRTALPKPAPERDHTAGDAREAPRTGIEATLARIWADVLDLPDVGIGDNFFQLGGDSILSIQVIARANDAGLRLTPKQLFQHQTIAELASVAGAAAVVRSDVEEAGADVPLTPIQRWFFTARIRQLHEFTQSAVFELDAGTDAAIAQALLDQLQDAHEALRFRYARSEEGWRQFRVDVGAHIPLTVIAAAGGDDRSDERIVAETARKLARTLNLITGPIACAALFPATAGGSPRLLMVAHHLVVDGVSWRILQEDVRHLLEQVRDRLPPRLPPRTTSFRQWARRLNDYARSADAAQALDFWRSRLQAPCAPLPLDCYDPDAVDTPASAHLISHSFSAAETRQLLQDVPKAYRTQINDVLLAALARTIGAWTGSNRVLLDLEGHGREPIFEDVDLSRTVGWFTSVYPVVVDVEGVTSPGELLRSVKEQLRAVPGRGLSHGVLRYLADNPEVTDRLNGLPQPQVCFNYLGQFGRRRSNEVDHDEEAGAGETGSGAVAGEGDEGTRAEWGSASHLLDINGGVNDGRLWLTWAFSTRFHQPKTIDAVANRFAVELRRLIAHCTSTEGRGYSPSDFPLAGLDQEKLEWLVGTDRQVADLYPLSPMQAGMLFHSLYDPDAGEYLEQSLSALPADLDPAALRSAWEQLVQRHAILRSAFVWSGLEQPLQMVRTEVDLPWQVHDWSAWDRERADEALERHLEEDRTRGFDLSRAPLLRFALFRMPDQGWWFLWTSHHISLDGWSQARLKAELETLYDAARRGEAAALEPVRPFRHYIEWLGQQDLTRAEVFWRETLRGFITPTPLMVDVDPDDKDEKTYLEQAIAFSAAESAAIDELARHSMVTANTAAQGAWALLLSRYSAEQDVVFGATVAGRPADLAGVERMVGLFINTLPVRIRIQPESSVGLWLRQIQRQQIDAREFEHAPLVQVQGWSDVPRGVPLFHSLLVFENYPDMPFAASSDEDAVADTTDGPGIPMERTNYPLTVAVIPGRRWSVRVTYDAAQIEGEAVRRLLGHYRRLLTTFAADPARPLAAVSLLTDGERQQLLVDWNMAATPALDALPAHRWFEAQAERTPNAVAVVANDEEVTYVALNARANRLAAQLAAAGERGLVGICLERSVEMVAAVLAVLKAGAGYVPLDPAYPRERLLFMLEDANAGVLITQPPLAPLFVEARCRIILADHGDVSGQAPADPDAPVGADDIAYVIYTSGSTGRPKGVAMPHGPLANLIRWHVAVETPRVGARTLQFAPLSFDVHFQEMFTTWAAGGTLVLIDEALRRDLPALLRHITAQRVDRLFVPFVALQALAETAAGSAVPALREVITAGEQLQISPAIRSLFSALPGATLHNHYGPSETHVVTAHLLGGDPDAWPELPPIGRPIPGARIYLLDDRLEPVPIGVIGQLAIGGSVLALGYVRLPDLTAARFVADPYSPGGGGLMYLTGDRARYLEDGSIEFLGREDAQVKVRGFRIELGEIEVALGHHPDVEQCVVGTIEPSPGDKRLVAYVVPAGPPGPPSAELRRFAEARLPDYMVPSLFVTLAALPLTASGKVDRKALPAPEGTRPDGDRPFVAPRDPVEARLAAIYIDVLQVDRIGVDDSFFDLGGHSLLATRIISRIRDAFQIELPLRTVFESPTVASIAGAVIAAGSQALRDQRIPRRREAGTCVLSYAQQRLWFLEQLHPHTSLYNVSRTFAFAGAVSVAAIEQALNEIVRRHEALRTTCGSVDGRPFQMIAASVHLVVPLHDLRRLGARRRAEQYRRLHAAIAEAPFDLHRGPLIRAALVRRTRTDSSLIVAIHHIATDGWSMEVFARELEALYRAAQSGTQGALPELPIQYADYAVWQRQRLDGEGAALELVRCRRRLDGIPASLDLPWDRPRPLSASVDGEVLSFNLPHELTRQLLAFGRDRGVTLYTVLLTAFTILLHRLSGSRDIVVGTPVSGRSHTELEGLIGLFVNTLVVRTDLTGRPTLEDLLGRVERAVLDAFDSQDVPFDRLVADIAPDRQAQHHPLVQVMFAVQDTGDVQAEQLTAPATPFVTVEAGTAKFDLTLTLFQSDGGLAGAFEYATALLEAATVERWASYFIRALEALIARPQLELEGLPLLSAAERARALIDWNHTDRDYPRNGSLGELFLEQVDAAPDATAVVYGRRSLTYREIDRLSARIAAHLRSSGVTAGHRVGVSMERSPEWVASLLAIVRCGAAYVPLDPSHPDERRRRILEDAAVATVLTADVCGSLTAAPDPVLEGDAESPAYVMYTSGSTGDPKGIIVPHRAIVRLVRATNYVAIARTDRIAQASHAAFDAATFEVWGALLNGATLVGIDRDTALSSARYASALREGAISTVFVTTALFNQVARDAPASFAPVRQVMFGGEAADPGAVRAVLAAGKPAHLMNVYGPTETTTFATFHEIEQLPEGETTIPIGKPIGHTQVYVLGPDLEPQPPGVPGEICIGGDGLAIGYLHAADLTNTRFVVNPFGPGRIYRTGDLGRYRPDGAIEFLGRTDHQVKVRGFRVETGEIETALRLHPAVLDALVQPRMEAGDGLIQLVAYVVGAAAASRPDPGELRRWLEARLPSYMVPVHLIELDALPLNSSGKIDRQALPAPETVRPAGAAAGGMPATTAEALVATIWRDLLRVETIGVDDNFFALGGHSLLAMQVVSRLRDAIGVEVPVRLIFERPTVAGLAGALGDSRGAESSGAQIAPRAALGSLPLSFSQQRLWFLDQMEPVKTLFNIQETVLFPGRFQRAALEATLTEVIRRHEVLRTAFTAIDGVAAQVVEPLAPVRLPMIDLTGVPRAGREAEVGRLSIEAAGAPFVLSRPPLFRAALVKLSARDHRLLLTLHHIVADGWSLAVLRREIEALYPAFVQGQPSPLPEPPVQYGDYAVWQRARLGSGALQPQVDYWRRQLANPPRATEIPLDRPRPAAASSAGARQTLQIPAVLGRELRRFCQREQVTPFMLLLAAFDLVLHRYTGQTDIVVGCPVAGRTRAEIEHLIGFFLNTLALRVDVSGNPPFTELLARVRQTALDAFANQDVPYEKILEELALDRAAHAQLFRVYFNVLSFDGAGGLAGEAVEGEPSGPVPASSLFDLTLYVFDQGETFVLDAVYRTDLYDAVTISRLLRHLQAVLEAAAEEPARRLLAVRVVADGAVADVPQALRLVRYREFPAEAIEQSIAARFVEQASRHARRTAVKSRRYDWTYAELEHHAGRVARELRLRGLAPGARVALVAAHDAPMIAGLLGILLAGGVYVPLDPGSPRERHLQMLADAEASLIVTDDPAAAGSLGIAMMTIDVERGIGVKDERDVVAPAVAIDPDALAYILYTSGSTGRPKGVAQSHRNVLHHCRTYTNALHLNARDRMALLASYAFDAAVMDIFGALLNGAMLCPLDIRREAPESVAEWLDAEAITIFHTTPTVYRHVLAGDRSRRFAAVRAVVLGGEEAGRRDVELYRARFSRRAVLVNGLGPTESTLALQHFLDHDTVLPRSTVPIGRAVAGTDVLLLDDQGQVIDGCGCGELAFRGRHVARGYWRDPVLTREKFVVETCAPGLVTYRSGDLAQRLPDGRLEFLGRRDLQVKIRGMRIELAEVEARLLEHDQVREAVVGPFEPDAGDARLAAYITSSSVPPPSAAAIALFLRQRLPDAMVPAAFIFLDTLPRTASGKIDRRRLPVPAAASLAVPDRPLTAPATATERTLAGIWRTLLRLQEVSATDNFFELGGHSLLATQLASRVRSLLQVELPLRQYFETPSLAALAARIDSVAAIDGRQQLPAIPRLSRELYRIRVDHAGHFVLPPALTASIAEREGPALDPSRTEVAGRAGADHETGQSSSSAVLADRVPQKYAEDSTLLEADA